MTTYHYRLDGSESYEIRIAKVGNTYQVSIQDRVYTLSEVAVIDGQVRFRLDGVQQSLPVVRHKRTVYVALEGQGYALEQPARRRRVGQGQGGGSSVVEATMPGTVQAILVSVGDAVTLGQPLVLLEAMKMELRLTASQAGVIKEIPVQPGQLVGQGEVLVTLQ